MNRVLRTAYNPSQGLEPGARQPWLGMQLAGHLKLHPNPRGSFKKSSLKEFIKV